MFSSKPISNNPPGFSLGTAVVVMVLFFLGTGTVWCADPDLQARVPPTESNKAAGTFVMRAGFSAELVAAEPLVTSPVALTVDEAGRAFVVEMRDYSERRPEHLGRVRLLQDSDQDGRYDSASVFLPGLPWPTAIMSWDGGVFIGATPDILYAKDTNGDGVADVREVVFTGFASDYAPYATNQLNVQALLNSFQWGTDCRIHGATSMSGGKVRLVDSPFTRAWRKRFGASSQATQDTLDLRGRDFSFDPRTLELRAETGGGQHGMSFNDDGRKFVCSNSDHLQLIAFDEVSVPSNPFHDLPGARRSIAVDGAAAEVFRKSPDEPWRVLRTRWRVSGVVPGMIEGGGRPSGYFTGATGVTIYRGDAYGPEFIGDAFIADCGSNLVHRKKLRPATDGILLLGERAVDERNSEFMASTDNWFRPVQFYNAPDGCLWVIDMYRETIEHPWSLPDPIKAHLDLDSGRDRGRLWRLKPKTSHISMVRAGIRDQGASNLVTLLSHPNAWHRDTAARLIYQQADVSFHGALMDRVRLFSPKTSEALGRLQAFGLLDSMGALPDSIVEMALQDGDPRLRALAYRWVRLHAPASRNVAAVLSSCAAQEKDPLAAWELIWCLGGLSQDVKLRALGAQLESHSVWIRSAAIHAAGPQAKDIWKQLMNQQLKVSSDLTIRNLTDLAFVVGREGDGAVLASVLEDAVQLKPFPSSIEVVSALEEGLLRRGSSLGKLDRTEKWAAWMERVMSQVGSGSVSGISPAAVRLMVLMPPQMALKALSMRLSADNPPEVRDAALTALSRFSGPDWAATLIAAMTVYSPEIQSRLQVILTQRSEGVEELLTALEKGQLTPGHISATTLSALRSSGDSKIRSRARSLLGEAPQSRQTAVEAFIPALNQPGDASRGKVLFQERCAGCHAWKGQGATLGPDLTSVASNGREKLLVSILDPNREVAPNYAAWTAETGEGQTITGIITRRTPTSVILRQAGGQDVTVEGPSLKTLRTEGRSLMPEGLEAGLNPAGLSDLLAFLTAR